MGILEYGLGYRGVVVLTKGATSLVVPVRSCNLNPDHALIVDENLHGGTNDANLYAATDVAYAQGAIQCRGSIEMALYESLWTTYKEWIYSDRTSTAYTLSYCPDGINWQQYDNVKIESATFTCTGGDFPGSAVTLSLNVIGARIDTDAGPDLTFDPTDPTCAGANLDKSPVPFWKTYIEATFADINTCTTKLIVSTEASGTGTTRKRPALSWGLTINNNTVATYALTGNRYPEYVTQGKMAITGDFVLFDPVAGVPLPSTNYWCDGFEIHIGTKTITLPRVVLENFPIPAVSPNTRVTRSYTYRNFAKDATSDLIVFSA